MAEVGSACVAPPSVHGPQPWPIVGRWDYLGVPLVVLAFVVYLLVTR